MRICAAVTLGCLAVSGLRPGSARAEPTYANDSWRTGWYPDQPGLRPTAVTGGFGQVFDAPVIGRVDAQPLVADNTLLVATEANWIYGLDPGTGRSRWARQLAPPWNASCSDLAPTVGVTGTPVVDPATHTAYFFAKTYVSGGAGPAGWTAHGIDLSTGNERAGFPVTIGGPADNQPGTSFDPDTEFQRPGLLLLGGVVYAAFGSGCDVGTYQGWVIGVPASGGAPSARWVAVSASAGETGAGIWQSGGGLISDGPGQLILVTGNGPAPSTATPGAAPPRDLGDSVLRLAVQPSGALTATDFFTPTNASELQAKDLDLGSGAPVALPDATFGSHPRLLAVPSKAGTVFLLNRDGLGGFGQAVGGGDAAVDEIPSGPQWTHPAVWPGDGGYLYIPSADDSGGCTAGHLRMFGYGTSPSGPRLTLAGTSQDGFGFGSGSPVVTSDSTTSGTAVMWMTWAPVAPATDPWQLRAYRATPVAGEPSLLWSAPIGQGTKFAPPGVWNGHLYVGTGDGHLRAFASGGTAASAGRSIPPLCGDGGLPSPLTPPAKPSPLSPLISPVTSNLAIPATSSPVVGSANVSTVPQTHSHVHPRTGGRHTIFALHMIAGEDLGGRDPTGAEYRVILSGGSHAGCITSLTSVVKRGRRGQLVVVRLAPPRRSGWCPGEIRGVIILQRGPECSTTAKRRNPASPCPIHPTQSGEAGHFSFRVR